MIDPVARRLRLIQCETDLHVRAVLAANLLKTWLTRLGEAERAYLLRLSESVAAGAYLRRE